MYIFTNTHQILIIEIKISNALGLKRIPTFWNNFNVTKFDNDKQFYKYNEYSIKMYFNFLIYFQSHNFNNNLLESGVRKLPSSPAELQVLPWYCGTTQEFREQWKCVTYKTDGYKWIRWIRFKFEFSLPRSNLRGICGSAGSNLLLPSTLHSFGRCYHCITDIFLEYTRQPPRHSYNLTKK